MSYFKNKTPRADKRRAALSAGELQAS